MLANSGLSVPNVRTVVAERTFWDKVVILHGSRQWFDARGALRGGGQRISRHYYDVYRLLDPISDAPLQAILHWASIACGTPACSSTVPIESRDCGARHFHALAKRPYGD